jgi:hypothetical protein
VDYQETAEICDRSHPFCENRPQSYQLDSGTRENDVRVRFNHTSTLPQRNSICDRRIGRVYSLAGAGLIKIGVTTNVVSRIRSIRNSSPVPLELLGVIPGNNFTESGLHERYANQRRHGEWFDDTPELRTEIDVAAKRWKGELW